MSVEFYRGSPGKFDSRTLSRETLSRWTGRIHIYIYICVCIHLSIYLSLSLSLSISLSLYIYIYIYIIIIHVREQLCDMSPAWDPPEGISFSNEFLWQISNTKTQHTRTRILLFNGFQSKRKSPHGDLKQETHRKAPRPTDAPAHIHIYIYIYIYV